eukprot:gene25797-229_t
MSVQLHCLVRLNGTGTSLNIDDSTAALSSIHSNTLIIHGATRLKNDLKENHFLTWSDGKQHRTYLNGLDATPLTQILFLPFSMRFLVIYFRPISKDLRFSKLLDASINMSEKAFKPLLQIEYTPQNRG